MKIFEKRARNVWISNHPARKMGKIFIDHISGWSERWYAPCFPKTAVWPTLQRSRLPANVVFSTHWILAVAGRAVAPFQRLKPLMCSVLHTLKWPLFFVVTLTNTNQGKSKYFPWWLYLVGIVKDVKRDQGPYSPVIWYLPFRWEVTGSIPLITSSLSACPFE